MDTSFASGYKGLAFVKVQELVEARKTYRTCFANLEAFINKVRTRGQDQKLARDILQPRVLAKDKRLQSPMATAEGCGSNIDTIINEAHKNFVAADNEAMTPIERKRTMTKGAGLVRIILTLHENERLLVEVEEILRAVLGNAPMASNVNAQ
ncbi:hypothetical protein ACHAPU_006394 [Fusarium lateritium]